MTSEITRRATYKRMEQYLRDALNDLSILAEDKAGPSNATWQDVAGTVRVNLLCLVNLLEAARQGFAESFLVFPSPEECLENEEAK